ncbi:VanW family protein [Adlercreutzia faecimuris]|uniref:VanW family protein n=1 Tax=Adlercreutzia faecimuris TaxID=2897341 RepID=A0ABS9WGC2_9ACTN|nr:VanW family protein [Adlercreutzia sp. JBNU-10]MCI2241908.1 VanW family protein [Adlercreutzia sp. JBNU-10]
MARRTDRPGRAPAGRRSAASVRAAHGMAPASRPGRAADDPAPRSSRPSRAADPAPRPGRPSRADGRARRTAAAGPSRSDRAPTAAAVASRAAEAALAGAGLAARGARRAGAAAAALLRRSRAARVAAALALAAVVVLGADAALTGGRVHTGVSVGSVDLSGMTRDEAERAIEGAYGERLAATRVVVFADEEARATIDVDMQRLQEQALAEQLSVEEAARAKRLWVTDAGELGATLPAAELADEALAVGRADGGLPARLGAAALGRAIPVRASYDGDSLEALAASLDVALGEPRADWTVAVGEDGSVSVVEGHGGRMVDRGWLVASLDRALLEAGPDDAEFTAQVSDAAPRTTEAQARGVAAALDAALARPLSFTYEQRTYDVTREEAAAWLDVAVEEGEGGAAITVEVSPARARATLLKRIHAAATGDPVRVTLSSEGGAVTVGTDGTVVIPQVDDALALIDGELLSPARAAGAPGAQEAPAVPEGALAVPVGAATAPASLSLDDALSCGLVEEVSSYTTRFANTESTANRTHNIQLICDILDGGIVEAGGSWSFNDRAGERTAERGFLGAGAIVDNEYADDVGGGICQVATTIFNAVYESGLPVDRRTNHSLYIASYPAGRDAAVSWPDLDLAWRNDTASDLLLRLTYTDDSITATLYGVDPGYSVSTQEGEWTPGKKHSTRTERDDSLAPGTSYVKTAGADGQRFSVTRTVKAQNGEVLREDVFSSAYAPITEVIVKGPDAPAADGAEAPTS